MHFQPRTIPPQRAARRAFTLIELLAVLAIVAILTSIVLSISRRASESGKVARAKAELAALAAALESYRSRFGDYPQTGVAPNLALATTASTDDGPGILFNALSGKRGPQATPLTAIDSRPFVEFARFTVQDATRLPVAGSTTQLANAFVDPWGHRYLYFYKTGAAWTNPAFVLYSVGPDPDHATAESECHTPPAANGFIDAAASGDADNLYANRH